MKVFIVLAACAVAVVSASKTHYGAGPLLRGPVAGPVLAAAPLVSTGTSSQFRSEDNYGNYNFGYDEAHSSGSTSRREEQVNGVRRGSYSLSDADGRHRHVNYVADASGFHASIHTNEPGVEPKDSADVLVNKEGPVAVAVAAPAPVYAAPAPIAAPAPVYAAPAPLPAPVPIADPLPAPVKGGYYHSGPRVAVAAPVAVAPAYIEEPTPRAFSYSFGSTHLAPAAPLPAPAYAAPAYAPLPAPAPLPHPAPLAAPAPIYQQQTLDY